MSTLELQTFIKHIRTLNLAVRSHIIPLAENLLAEELISPDNYCSLTTAKDDEVERAAKLLSFVLIKVELSPRNYHVFVKVLISDRSTYKEVLNVLEPIYKEPLDFSEIEDRSDITISDPSCKSLTSAAPVPPHLQCQTPGCPNQKRLNEDGTVYFAYCSISCRDNAMLTSASTPNLQNPSGCGTCSLPGCSRPKYCDPANSRVHDFCGRTHAAQARAQGIQPASQGIIRQANSMEVTTVSQKFITIRSASSQEFTTVSLKFIAAWKKGICPSVKFVYVVSNSTLESRWSVHRQNLRDQTVEKYYHGTKLTCNLAQPPCNSRDCGICEISSLGAGRNRSRHNINFQGYSNGFYLVPDSSMSHKYTKCVNSYRAMLLCDVCREGTDYIKTNNVNLRTPPLGRDYVYEQVEDIYICVKNPDAVLPRYIIVYQDGVHDP